MQCEKQIITSVFPSPRKEYPHEKAKLTHWHTACNLAITHKQFHLCFWMYEHCTARPAWDLSAHINKTETHLASQVCRQAWRRCGQGRCAGLSSGHSPRLLLESRTAAGGRSSASLCFGCYLVWRGQTCQVQPNSWRTKYYLAWCNKRVYLVLLGEQKLIVIESENQELKVMT